MKLYCNACKHIFKTEYQENGVEVPCPQCQAPVAMPEAKIAPGVVVDGYLIEREIGQGGMGKVYEAKQLSLDRPVALKVLLDKFAQNRDYVKGLMREARAAAKINHPNIVQAYSVGEEDGVVFFAMEMIRGETMKQRLKREKILKFDEAAKIIRDVASALDVAWREQKLVHQDIKPDNIMLNDNGFAKLADLGLAKTSADPEEEAGDEVMGTPQYISPEQLTGVPTDVRSDIYSLGATFYQFVTGRFPYVADTGEELAHMHIDGNLQPPKEVNPELPDELNAIIVKMMARDINKRYQEPKLLIKALDVFLRSYQPVETATVPKFDIKKQNIKIPAMKVPSLKTPAAKAPVIPALKPSPQKKEEKGEEELSLAPKPAVALNVTPPPKQEKTAPEPPKVIPADKIVPVAKLVEEKPLPVTPKVVEVKKEEKKEEAKEEEVPLVQPVSAPAPEEAAEGSAPAEEVKPRKKFRSPLWLLIVLIVLFVLAGAAAGLWFFRDRIPFVKKLLPAQTTETAPEKTEETAGEKPAEPAKPAKPVTPPKPAEPPKPVTRKAFMQKINDLRNQARSGKLTGMALLKAGDKFILEFQEPVTAEENFALNLFIDEFYAKADETLRVAPARQKAADEYAQAAKRREQQLKAEEDRRIAVEEDLRQKSREAEENKRQAEITAQEKNAEAARLNALRLQTAQQEIQPLKQAVAAALKESITAYNPAALQTAINNGKRYRLPLGIPGPQETQLLRNFHVFCNQAMAEFNLYKAFRQRLTKITDRRPFQLPGKKLLTIVGVAPGKITTFGADGSPVEVQLTSQKMKNNFLNRLHLRLNREKGPKFSLKQVTFYYELMEGNFEAEPYNAYWKQILSMQQ